MCIVQHTFINFIFLGKLLLALGRNLLSQSMGPSHLFHIYINHPCPVIPTVFHYGMQSKVCKSVFSCRPILVLSPNPAFISPSFTKPSPPLPRPTSPQAGQFNSKKLKIAPTEFPSKYATSRRADEEKNPAVKIPRARGAPRWGRGLG